MLLPRYPIYIPSKGRADKCLTAECLVHDKVPFYVVVEPEEKPAYAAKFGAERILTLPFSNPGSVIPARNWIKAHATKSGALRHWQLDDNMRNFRRVFHGKRLYCNAGIALRVAEDFCDRYENIAVGGLNYTMFYTGQDQIPPFYLNCHVYSCTLILNSIPYEWRGRYNEDTDLCLQVLSGGWCTVLINAFLADKVATMKMTGGNTTALYHGDGRLRMARALERMWPGVVETKRRFQRPQHVVLDAWRRFDTPLKLKAGVKIKTGINEYGMQLKQVAPIKSASLRQFVKKHSKI